ncbi:MAG: aspartate kinase, partial [Planctomycetota bacterium]
VDGIYTSDPRVVPEARRVGRISYDEMLELASVGAGVMHNRSIEFAKKFSVPVHVRSSISDNPGTMITSEPEAGNLPVCGAAALKNEARITVLGVPDRPGAAITIFSKIAAKKIAVDMIVQNVAAEGHADISFTVLRDDLPATLKAVQEGTDEVGAEGCTYDDDVSKISVVGLGMATQSGVAERMFRALAERGINILMITTSEIKISVLVQREHATEAVRTVHEAFRLEAEPPAEAVPEDRAAREPSPGAAPEIVARLQGMENLIIEDITLDESQARVTLMEVPDTPGLAAQVFDEVAENNIVVDMIVQSIGGEGRANVSFTVLQTDLAKSVEVAASLAKGFGCPSPTSDPKVAKLSVLGTGMRSHTTVAARMFRSLADAGINVDMISTSEIHLNVVVDGSQGLKSLEVLKKEFADVML